MPIQSTNFTISGVSPTFAQGAGVLGSAFSGFQEFSRAALILSGLGATGGTLNLIAQTSFDGKHVGDSTKVWYDAGAWLQIAALATPGDAIIELTRSNSGVAPVNLTKGTMAAGTVVGTLLGDALRVWAVPGAGTTIGALQSIAVSLFTVP